MAMFLVSKRKCLFVLCVLGATAIISNFVLRNRESSYRNPNPNPNPYPNPNLLRVEADFLEYPKPAGFTPNPNPNPVHEAGDGNGNGMGTGMGAARVRVAGFHHVFVSGDHFQSIVDEQIQAMRASGLLHLTSNIFYVTVGDDHGYDITVTLPPHEAEKFYKLARYQDAWEMTTLGYMHDYCRVNPLDKVFYFHTKGAFHPSEENTQYRQILGCYTLSQRCLNALDKFDTCGMRYSPLPHMHYPGNFWWARCSYINTLIDPREYQRHTLLIQSQVTKGQKVEEWCFGQGRFFAETWIASHPALNAADCLGPMTNKSYLYGYSDLPSVAEACANLASTHTEKGTPFCGVAAINATNLVRSQVPKSLRVKLKPKFKCGDLVTRLVLRARAWYPDQSIDKLKAFMARLKSYY